MSTLKKETFYYTIPDGFAYLADSAPIEVNLYAKELTGKYTFLDCIQLTKKEFNILTIRARFGLAKSAELSQILSN